ncbi:MAG TPA: glycosyltransferase [Abditibacteriaceae bacterium]|jgi:glycosyltransferase involved in cell wall biosynthesis
MYGRFRLYTSHIALNPITSQILEELSRAGVELSEKLRGELEARFDGRFGEKLRGDGRLAEWREDLKHAESRIAEWRGDLPFASSETRAGFPDEDIAPPNHSCLRVGLMTDTYLPFSNGVTHMVALLAKALVARGHEPHIFTFASPGAFRASLKDHEGIQVHHAPALRVSRAGYHFATRYPLRIRRILRQMDVIHAHHPFISGRIAWRFKRAEQPLLFTNHTRYDIYGHYLQNWLPFVPEDQVRELLTYRAARLANRCDCVISPSASVASLLKDWGVNAPITTVPNGIELGRFQDAARAKNPEFDRTFRARWNWPENAKVAVYLGRLVSEKNIAFLLEAWARVREENGEARLLLVGDGPLEDELKAHARILQLGDSVRFAGKMDYAEVPQSLAACDIFVSASVSEVHPLTFIEAMASGLAPVGTHSPGVADTVCDDDEASNGWLCDVPAGHPHNNSASDAALREAAVEQFAHTLSHALGDEEERKQRAARAKVDSSRYSIDATADATLQLYCEVLSARSVRPSN